MSSAKEALTKAWLGKGYVNPKIYALSFLLKLTTVSWCLIVWGSVPFEWCHMRKTLPVIIFFCSVEGMVSHFAQMR